MATLLSHTIYAQSAPLIRSAPYRSHQAARSALASILRQVRSDLSIVVIKEGHEAYLFTNTLGPMVFERTLRIIPY
jgi:hypothetical protein